MDYVMCGEKNSEAELTTPCVGGGEIGRDLLCIALQTGSESSTVRRISQTSEEHSPKQDRPKQDGPKQDRPKQDGPKQDEPKQDGPKQDDPKEDGPKEIGSKQDGPKEDGFKRDGPKDKNSMRDGTEEDGSKQDGPKKDGSKQDSSKQDGIKPDSSQQDGLKPNGPKQESPNQDGPKEDGSKQDGPKEDGSKQDDPKEDGFKRDSTKEGGSKQDGPKEDGSKQAGPKEDGSKQAGPKEDGSKHAGPKQDGSKKDDPKEDGPKQDGSKQDGPKEDGCKWDSTKEDSSKQDGPKEDGSKQAGPKEDGSKQTGPMEDGSKQAGPKQDGPKEDGSKRDGSKRDGFKQDGPKQDGPKRDGPKRDGPKRDGPKRDGSKEKVNDPTSDNQYDVFSSLSSLRLDATVSTITAIVNGDGKDGNETDQGEREPYSLNLQLHSDPPPLFQQPDTHTELKDVESLSTSWGQHSLNLQLLSNPPSGQQIGSHVDSKNNESISTSTGQNSQPIARASNLIELNPEIEVPSDTLDSVKLSVVQAIPEKTNISNILKLALWKERKVWTCLVNCTSSEQPGPLNAIVRSLYNAWHCVIVNDHREARRILSDLDIITYPAEHERLIRLQIFKVQSLLALLEGNKRGLLELVKKTTSRLSIPYLPGEAGQAAWVYLHYGRSIEDGKQYWMNRARQLFQQDTCLCNSTRFENTIAAHCSTIIPNRDTAFQEFYTELVVKPLICHTFEFFQ